MKGCGESGRDESRPYNAGTRPCNVGIDPSNTGTHPSVGARFCVGVAAWLPGTPRRTPCGCIAPDIPPKFITPNALPDTPTFNPDIHHRRSLRVRDYNYSQAGAYFITICTRNRECLFGNVEGNAVLLNDVGRVVQGVWDALPVNFLGVELDAFVVMPNHVHGIIILNNVGVQFIAPHKDQGAMHPQGVRRGVPGSHAATPTQNRAPTLGEIIRAFKARCTHRINQLRGTHGFPVWQRNYYEHVIRSESSLQEIREYISNNPAQWAFDRENPDTAP